MKDVVIVGGGLVGGLTALLLQQEGVDVTVLDAAPILDPDKVLETTNPRVLALSKATIHLLEKVEVWDKVARYMPYTGMHVWNQNGYGDIEFGKPTKAPERSQWLGAMVEPSVLNLAIQLKMQQQVTDYRTCVQVTRVEKAVEGWCITLADGTQVNTKLVIGADGANSFVRDQSMIKLDTLAYKQSAISCAIKTQQPHLHVARQIFLPTGPLAFLPMKEGNWVSIVWTLPEDHTDEYIQLDDDAFKTLLEKSSLHMLDKITDVTERASFPLKARAAEHYVQDGLALVGDAAHVIHPLAGQGVNIGCLDAAVLCDALLNDKARGVWANLSTLRRYEHIRKGQNEAMMHSMSAIGWLEKSTFTPLVWLRNFGLKRVQNIPQLKEQFMHQASGLNILNKTRYSCIKN